MFGLPKDLDLRFLHEAVLYQVSIGQNEVILRFGDDMHIGIESTFVVRDAAGVASTFDSAPESAASLVGFLGTNVSSVLGLSDGTLCLSFSNGGVIEIRDSNPQHESYQIHHGAKVYVV